MRDTWLWHCPFLTSEQVAGLGHFPNSSPVHGTGTELVQVPLLQAADLGVQKGRPGQFSRTLKKQKKPSSPLVQLFPAVPKWIPCKRAEESAEC